MGTGMGVLPRDKDAIPDGLHADVGGVDHGGARFLQAAFQQEGDGLVQAHGALFMVRLGGQVMPAWSQSGMTWRNALRRCPG